MMNLNVCIEFTLTGDAEDKVPFCKFHNVTVFSPIDALINEVDKIKWLPWVDYRCTVYNSKGVMLITQHGDRAVGDLEDLI